MHGHATETEKSTVAGGHRARLRKRLFEGGPKALLDHELVEYLLALAGIGLSVVVPLFFARKFKLIPARAAH